MLFRFQQEMPADVYKIVKVGGSHTVSKPVKKKTMRTYPRGVLKKGGSPPKGIKPVRDPASPPPLAAGRKATLRILTEKGMSRRRETIRRKVKAMSAGTVRETLRKSGLPISDKTPAHIAEEILAGGMEAGMIVSK
jgi:hypothetical protein